MFGTSAKYIDACAKAEIEPKRTHDLSTVRMIASTARRLAPESFDYVYEKVKSDVCLSSISGGTDIVSCFMLGNPTGPVWRGEIQMRGLGLKVEVWNDEGSRWSARRASWSATRPFPCMPVGFWNDEGNKRYKAAYFEKFPNVWHHGDYVELTAHGGIIVHGRSDAVLQSRRRTDRHGGDLPPGRAAAGDPGKHSSSARTGSLTCASCCSCGCAKA